MNPEAEAAFVRAFILPERQERYLTLLSRPKQRQKILARLQHNLDVIPALTTEVSGRNHEPETVERTLRQRGAGETCYLISPERKLDRQELPLGDAVQRFIVSDSVGIAVCIPDRLAYYKAEDGPFPG